TDFDDEAAISPAPCEEGVFYVTGCRCQPCAAFRRSASGDWSSFRRSEASADRAEVHSTDSGVSVNREFRELLRKTQVETSTSTAFHRLQRVPVAGSECVLYGFPRGRARPSGRKMSRR
ncbi:MAG: hypothetical protein ACQEUN_17190, partial [Pseudomonadota bacterium]